MIYLDNSQIILPNLLNIDSSSYRLVLKNNVTNEKATLDASNISDNELYYTFNIDSSSMALNEYTITLYDDTSMCLGTFLAQKGIAEYKDVSAFLNDIHYIQFE